MQQYTYDDFLRDHCTALESMKVPELYWPALHSKLLGKEFDVPQHFELGLLNYTDPESGDVVDKELFVSVKSDEILSSDSDSIFLIDHAWTFELADVRKTLVSNPSLLSRMVNLMCLNEKEINGNESAAVDEFMRKMWKFCHLYQISKPSEVDGDHIVIKKDVWYILDEFGSSIKQSSEPNVRVASFMYVPERLCYSVFWPIVDLHKEDTLYVDWLSAVTDSDKKSLLLLPWEDQDFSDRSSAHSYVLTDDFFSSHKIQESLPEPGAPFVSVCSLPLKVYTDINLVAETLSSPSYEVTEERNEADILWLYSHFRDYKRLSIDSPSVFVNQFPNESVLTVKDMLAALAASERAIEISGPGDAFDLENEGSPKQPLTCSWYPVTFNLFYELSQFVAFFQRQEEEEPWNLGRGLGIFITDNLAQILRLTDSGPMIASRYISDPVLFYREDISSWVKFDVRYVVLLKSVQPLELFAHKVFWLRFANKAFSLDNFDDYAKHFTVMNYREHDELKQVHHDEFIESFEKQYPNVKWKNVEAAIHRTLVDLFTVASAYPPPRGLGDCKQSRAMYAVDLMLEWQRRPDVEKDTCFVMQPQVCEVNFIPDCTRACKYHPEFHNEVFDCLFLNRVSDNLQQLA
ncbi:unnamed protein product [Mesocestoides corti]|uniref:Tubulin--tyrosine ligase-like protein 12 SET-like domain-containing protein n=1 Tax=Mesocestoides corti TaxID=53468 RepID=A0A0R3UEX8_MESCO|nr:unnamed protein product [Mesocestoides corti]